MASIFDYDFDVDRILDELGNVVRGKAIIPGKPLVIFDEIQACPNAITSLKYFCENKRELHIVCAGSLLGVSIKRDGISFPVGKVDRLQMYPMTFAEFLRADGGQNIFDGVRKYALEWLVDAGLVHKLELVTNPELPLAFCSNTTYFKLYLSDVGLLRRKSRVSHKTILEDTELYRAFRGAFTENYVLTELIRLGINPYFWRSGNTAELDFLFEYENEIIPVEVKAALQTRAKSYRQYCKRYEPGIGFKFSMKNVGRSKVEKTETYSTPLYMIWMLRSYLTAGSKS